jgi:hypothetical protein
MSNECHPKPCPELVSWVVSGSQFIDSETSPEWQYWFSFIHILCSENNFQIPPPPPFLKGGEGGLAIFIVRG